MDLIEAELSKLGLCLKPEAPKQRPDLLMEENIRLQCCYWLAQAKMFGVDVSDLADGDGMRNSA